DRHGLVVPFPPDPAEVEALIDGFLKLDRLAPALGIPLGELREPLGPHPDVGDLIGEDELDGALEDRVADLPRDVDELVEDVAREPLEPAVDAGHARGGVLGAGAAPEDRGLDRKSTRLNSSHVSI